MKKIILSAIVISTLFLNGCFFPSLIGVTSVAVMSANDRRTTGAILDDKNIKFNLSAWTEKKIEDAHLNYMVYGTEVLVTGEVPNKQVRDYITKQIPLRDFKISRVINELRVAPNSDLSSRAKDSVITTSIELQFLDQEVFNPIHVKVMTENRSVYLMGEVTLREAKKAAKVASTVSGVKRVVKLFRYIKTRPRAEIQREKEKALQAKKAAEEAKERKIIEDKRATLRRQLRALETNDGTDFSQW